MLPPAPCLLPWDCLLQTDNLEGCASAPIFWETGANQSQCGPEILETSNSGPAKTQSFSSSPSGAAPPGGASEPRFPDSRDYRRAFWVTVCVPRRAEDRDSTCQTGSSSDSWAAGVRGAVAEQQGWQAGDQTTPAPPQLHLRPVQLVLLWSSGLLERGELSAGVPEAPVTEVPRIWELLSWRSQGAGQPVCPPGLMGSNMAVTSAITGTSQKSGFWVWFWEMLLTFNLGSASLVPPVIPQARDTPQ